LSLRTIAGVGLVALVVDTAFVWAFASPTVTYMAAVVAHLLIGAIVAACAGWLFVADRLWRQTTLAVAAAAAAVATATAGYLVAAGNTRDHSWILQAHIAAGVGAIAFLLPYAVQLARRRERSFSLAFQGAVALLAILPAGAWFYAARYPAQAHRIVNPRVTPLSMQGEGGGPSSPFFPSSATTTVGGTIPADFFTESDTCGECHRDIYEQWKGSMHHFASFNNQFYRKSIEHMQAVVGTQPSKWCAGCHDHAVFFDGRFDRPIAEQIDTPEARAGLGCTSCHSIVRVGSSMGNGDFTIEYPPLHRLASSRNRYIRALDRFLTYLDPEPHRQTFLKPFMRQQSAEFCASCHKVHLDKPVNDYRWFRGFNDYDAWQASGVSGQGARSFYYPAQTQTCVDCHMPAAQSSDPGHHADGTVHSHRFAAANIAVPFVNHDAAQLAETERFLKSGFVTVDIFSASPADSRPPGTPMVRRPADAARPMSSFAVGEEAELPQPSTIRNVGEIAAPLDKARPAVRPGSNVRVDVVVRTRKIGHFFPGGTVDAFDVWLELEARDAGGRSIFWSGRVEDGGKGPVEPGAHFYRSYQLDADGNPINKRNAWQTRSALYVRLIPPGAADVAHYRIAIPPDARGPISLTAKLNYRKFSHYYTQFAFAGQPQSGAPASLVGPSFDNRKWTFDAANIPANVSSEIRGRIPDLPIVTVAHAEATLPLADGTATTWAPIAGRADRERWNDWGIGLLLQGDLKGAQYAFLQVTKAEPAYADGWLNMARALIQEGETDAAKPFIAEALARDSSLGRIHYFKALIEKADGDYEGALRSLDRASAAYPRDRVVLNQIARILFLSRRFDEALRVLDRVQDVDPEDLQMHYTAMLCYRALGKDDLAAREETLFTRFKADEASQAITQSRRLISPEDNNERQPIHEHDSVPLSDRR
jgi:Flp pilus assembly protein TadD/nitrate/TMAO reductase-like tetraheme cytochrome c subunit